MGSNKMKKRWFANIFLFLGVGAFLFVLLVVDQVATKATKFSEFSVFGKIGLILLTTEILAYVGYTVFIAFRNGFKELLAKFKARK